jgi:hypothetical protein
MSVISSAKGKTGLGMVENACGVLLNVKSHGHFQFRGEFCPSPFIFLEHIDHDVVARGHPVDLLAPNRETGR